MSKDIWGIHADRAGIGTGKPDWYQLASKMVKQHEGWAPEPYRDTLGHLTIGYGCKLPLSKADGDALLEVRLRTAFHDAAHLFKGFGLLDTVRCAVLVDMAYNLGRPSLSKFVKFRAAVERRDWPAAKQGMLDSRWAGQVPGRAQELAEMMLRGE